MNVPSFAKVNWKLWLQEFTTIIGSAGFLGALAAVLTHQITWDASVPLFVAAIVAVLMPQNHTGQEAIVAASGTAAGMAAAIKGGQPVAALVAPAVGNFANALQIVSAAHAATPPGGTTVTQIVDGQVHTATTTPVPVAALVEAIPVNTVTEGGQKA